MLNVNFTIKINEKDVDRFTEIINKYVDRVDRISTYSDNIMYDCGIESLSAKKFSELMTILESDEDIEATLIF